MGKNLMICFCLAAACLFTACGPAVESRGEDNTEYTYLDVRTQEEVDAGAIPGSIHINYYDDNFEDQVAQLDKEKPYMVYCKSGGRSSKAVSKMKKLGFYNAYNMSGGYTKWKKNN